LSPRALPSSFSRDVDPIVSEKTADNGLEPGRRGQTRCRLGRMRSRSTYRTFGTGSRAEAAQPSGTGVACPRALFHSCHLPVGGLSGGRLWEWELLRAPRGSFDLHLCVVSAFKRRRSRTAPGIGFLSWNRFLSGERPFTGRAGDRPLPGRAEWLVADAPLRFRPLGGRRGRSGFTRGVTTWRNTSRVHGAVHSSSVSRRGESVALRKRDSSGRKGRGGGDAPPRAHGWRGARPRSGSTLRPRRTKPARPSRRGMRGQSPWSTS
jgi:hypothetical protein